MRVLIHYDANARAMQSEERVSSKDAGGQDSTDQNILFENRTCLSVSNMMDYCDVLLRLLNRKTAWQFAKRSGNERVAVTRPSPAPVFWHAGNWFGRLRDIHLHVRQNVPADCWCFGVLDRSFVVGAQLVR
jgi:hypothetical protein